VDVPLAVHQEDALARGEVGQEALQGVGAERRAGAKVGRARSRTWSRATSDGLRRALAGETSSSSPPPIVTIGE
jgi:hypothetical protein